MILVKSTLNYISIFCILLFFYSCNQNKIIITGTTMGTTYSISINNFKHNSDDYKKQIDSLLLVVDNYFSTYNNNSEISKINNDYIDNITLSDTFKEVLSKAIYYCEISDGSYDITIEPLVQLWGFGKKKNITFPDIDSVNESMKNIGFDNLLLKDNELIKKNNIKIDLNSIAKGYGVDKVYDFIKSNGYSSFLVEIGGEIRSQGDTWVIGMQNPRKNGYIQKIILENKSLATSGTYYNYFTHENKTYSHIINPKTGYPYLHNTVSATVIADKCIDADAFATLAMTMNPEEVITLINNHDGVECYILQINNDNETLDYKSKNFEKFILY